jgi:TPR repeat protein
MTLMGVERNLQIAVFWYEYAASNDDIEELGNLALKAAKQGHKKASAELKKILNNK